MANHAASPTKDALGHAVAKAGFQAVAGKHRAEVLICTNAADGLVDLAGELGEFAARVGGKFIDAGRETRGRLDRVRRALEAQFLAFLVELDACLRKLAPGLHDALLAFGAAYLRCPRYDGCIQIITQNVVNERELFRDGGRIQLCCPGKAVGGQGSAKCAGKQVCLCRLDSQFAAGVVVDAIAGRRDLAFGRILEAIGGLLVLRLGNGSDLLGHLGDTFHVVFSESSRSRWGRKQTCSEGDSEHEDQVASDGGVAGCERHGGLRFSISCRWFQVFRCRIEANKRSGPVGRIA